MQVLMFINRRFHDSCQNLICNARLRHALPMAAETISESYANVTPPSKRIRKYEECPSIPQSPEPGFTRGQPSYKHRYVIANLRKKLNPWF